MNSPFLSLQILSFLEFPFSSNDITRDQAWDWESSFLFFPSIPPPDHWHALLIRSPVPLTSPFQQEAPTLHSLILPGTQAPVFVHSEPLYTWITLSKHGSGTAIPIPFNNSSRCWLHSNRDFPYSSRHFLLCPILFSTAFAHFSSIGTLLFG